MNNVNTIASLMIDNLKSVKVKFFKDSEKLYTYKTLLTDLEVDDFVVVSNNNYYKVVQVVEIDDIPDLNIDSNIEYKWIVQKVDAEQYNELIQMEYDISVELKRLQQKSIVSKAKDLLAETLGIDKEDLDKLTSISKD